MRPATRVLGATSAALLLAFAACHKRAPVVENLPQPPAPAPTPAVPQPPPPPPKPKAPYPTATYADVTLSASEAHVAPAGDIDGDGMADLVVGLPGDGGGAVGVVFGKTLAKLGPGQSFSFDRQISALDATDRLGASVVGLGDIDGDGTGDLLIGAPGYDKNGKHAGGAWLMLGKTLRDDPHAGLDKAWTFFYGDANDKIGEGLANLGDLDHDGLAEVIFPGRRRTYLMRGSELANYESFYLPDAKTWLVGSVEGVDFMPKAVPAGDTRGDGWGGALLATEGEDSHAWLIHGDQLGKEKIIDLDHDAWGRFTVPGTWLGDVLAAADLNGDHRPDPLLGWQKNGQWVLSAVDAGYLYSPAAIDIGKQSFLTIHSDPQWSIASAVDLGDLDGDGYDELAIGTRTESGAPTARVYVFRGKSLYQKSDVNLSAADAIFDYHVDTQTYWWTAKVIAPGDLNGDGKADLVVLLQGSGWQDDKNAAPARLFVHESPWTWRTP